MEAKATHVTFIPESARDSEVVRDVIGKIHSAGAPGDSGKALLGLLPHDPPLPIFSRVAFEQRGLKGTWVATPGSDSSAVILYLHGRRFQFDEPVELYAPRLAKATGLPVLKADYRLAPGFPYPAALDDVLAIYQALLDLTIPSHRIVIVGHSAGATLALSAALCLAKTAKPLPAAIVAMSAIADFTFGGQSIARNAGKDIVSQDELLQTRTAYLGGASPGEAPQSPVFGPFTGLPPLLMVSGGSELLLDDCRRLADAASAAGVDVSMDIFDGMPHGFAVTHTDGSAIALERVAQFVKSRLMGPLLIETPTPVTVRRIGWAGYIVTTEHGTKVLVDPYLKGGEGFHQGLPESPVPMKELFGVDLVAVTHAGFDHRGQSLDIVSAGNATLACGPALLEEALKRGIDPSKVAVMVSGAMIRFKDVTLKAVPARHESSMAVNGHSTSDQPLSFILKTSHGSCIFCGGDSSISQDMKTWGELYHPQVAVLGIGGIWVGPLSVVELPPAEAAKAAGWLGVDTVIPVHYAPGDPAPAQLKSNLIEMKSAIEVATLGFGDTWSARAVG